MFWSTIFFAKEFQRYPLSVHWQMCPHHQICVASQGSEKEFWSVSSSLGPWVKKKKVSSSNFCYHFQPRQWDFISMLQRAVQRQYPAERAGLCSQQHTCGSPQSAATLQASPSPREELLWICRSQEWISSTLGWTISVATKRETDAILRTWEWYVS